MNSKTSKIVAWLGTGPNGGADVVTTNEIQVREWKRLGLTIIPLVEQPAELAEQQGVEQPPLPRTHYNACGDGSEPLYTAEQMQDYARAALAARLAGAQVPIAWTTGITWDKHQSEQVRKLTRDSQPEHGFTRPIYDAPPAQGIDLGQVSIKSIRQFIADRTPNDEHREDILSGDYDHTAWFDHIRELMATLAVFSGRGGLGQFRDLIGFAVLQAINLPETDPRRDFIRQANEFLALIDQRDAAPGVGL